MIDGVLYCNDGDWVESLTALVEEPDGTLRLIDWSQVPRHVEVPVPEGADPTPEPLPLPLPEGLPLPA
jgi:hypothetical protein